MTFKVTFNFPADQHGSAHPSTYTYIDSVNLAHDLVAEGFGDKGTVEYLFRKGMEHALIAVLQGMAVDAILNITGDTHAGYYAEPVTMTVKRTE